MFRFNKSSEEPSQSPPPDTSMPEQRKGILARLRNLQISRNDPKPEILPDDPLQTVDPEIAAKAARREARREQRRQREEQWNEEYRQRRNFAIEVGTEMRPLTPLSDFDSASEDERQPPPINLSRSLNTNPSRSKKDPFIGEGANPPHPPLSQHQTESQPEFTRSVSAHDTPIPELPSESTEPTPAPHDPNEDAQLAEMFAAQAFTSTPSIPTASQKNSHPSYSASQPQKTQPAPIGWGGVYHSVPSQPMYGTPAHLSPVPRTLLDIDPILAARIRRGRELAMLAIGQEERGNLGAAEAGYIKALALLVPASKDLDIGSELNKNARMQQKAKIQREAAAMLDRCEELRVFLRANGPTVPSEMPVMPNETTMRKPTSGLNKQSSLGSPPSRNLPPTPTTFPPVSTTSHSNIKSERNKSLPQPPDLRESHGRSQLLTRLTSRKDVLASASTVIPPDNSQRPAPSDPPSVERHGRKSPPTDEKCFMCSAPAHLQTKCGHTYCSNCGNQAVSVFGQCPVPDCGARIAVKDFKHIF